MSLTGHILRCHMPYGFGQHTINAPFCHSSEQAMLMGLQGRIRSSKQDGNAITKLHRTAFHSGHEHEVYRYHTHAVSCESRSCICHDKKDAWSSLHRRCCCHGNPLDITHLANCRRDTGVACSREHTQRIQPTVGCTSVMGRLAGVPPQEGRVY